MKKTKVKFAGVNVNGDDCYVSEKGSYLAKMDGTFYALNQAPEYGLDGIDGEPAYPVNPECIEIVNNF